MPKPAAIEFIDLPEVERRVALKKTAIYRAMRQGEFPRPAKITTKAVRWVVSEIEAWQRERVAARAA